LGLVLRDVRGRLVPRNGPVPGSHLRRLEPAARAHDRVSEPPPRTRPTGDRALDGRLRLHARPRDLGADGGPADNIDGPPQPRAVPRHPDVCAVRLHPRPLAHDGRTVARGDAAPFEAHRERPRVAVPPAPGADEPSQAVTATGKVEGRVMRCHATECSGARRVSRGADHACNTTIRSSRTRNPWMAFSARRAFRSSATTAPSALLASVGDLPGAVSSCPLRRPRSHSRIQSDSDGVRPVRHTPTRSVRACTGGDGSGGPPTCPTTRTFSIS